ncbi:MAG: DUF3179 domain-containing protein [Phycisphaerales bacterium]|nr:MAG: DUF3179 domain-containing protein [Phycisphaerales bacterium]
MKSQVMVRSILAGMAACSAAFAQEPPAADGGDFRQIERPGAVDLEQEYDLSGLTIPRDQIHTLAPRDAIPALTDPKLERADQAGWLRDSARVIEVTVGDDVLGVPLNVLDRHEVVNAMVGGEPVAVTYCPLCDSAAVFSRRWTGPDGKSVVLEFGVSGALYNSNVLMYDRTEKGLWSQLGMSAVSGPRAGTALNMLPVRVVTLAAFRKAHAGARIVSKDTGFDRDYEHSPYATYFAQEGLWVPVAGIGSALPRKTRGVGIAVGDAQSAWSWFVPVEAIGDARTIDTPAGKVLVGTSDAGVVVWTAPPGVRTAQTFYYSWSAFYPQTRVVRSSDPPGAEAIATPGLVVGDRAPNVTVTGVDGRRIQLASLYGRGPIVLTFYRGGWCPICNRALSAWHDKLDDLTAAGGKLVALTPEKPTLARATRDKVHGEYEVYSDTNHAAAKVFKVYFVVDEATRAKYEEYGLKVGEANASGTWELPAPATFVIDEKGVIRYVFADWDYKKRADPDEVIQAVRSLKR